MECVGGGDHLQPLPLAEVDIGPLLNELQGSFQMVLDRLDPNRLGSRSRWRASLHYYTPKLAGILKNLFDSVRNALNRKVDTMKHYWIGIVTTDEKTLCTKYFSDRENAVWDANCISIKLENENCCPRIDIIAISNDK